MGIYTEVVTMSGPTYRMYAHQNKAVVFETTSDILLYHDNHTLIKLDSKILDRRFVCLAHNT